MTSALRQQHVEIGRGALADILAVGARNASALLRPSSFSSETNSHSALSFDDAPKSASLSVMIRCVRIPAQRAPSPCPGSATWRSSAIMRNSFISGELKEISLSRLRISFAVRGGSGRSRGLICTRMVSCASLSRTSGVMVGLPA